MLKNWKQNLKEKNPWRLWVECVARVDRVVWIFFFPPSSLNESTTVKALAHKIPVLVMRFLQIYLNTRLGMQILFSSMHACNKM